MKNFISFKQYQDTLNEKVDVTKKPFQSSAYSVKRRATRVFHALKTMEPGRIVPDEVFKEEDPKFSNILVPKDFFNEYPKEDIYISFSKDNIAKLFFKRPGKLTVDVECDACNGEGTKIVNDPKTGEEDIINCPKCHGTGTIKQSVVDEDETILTFIPSFTDVATLFVCMKKDAPVEFLDRILENDKARESQGGLVHNVEAYLLVEDDTTSNLSSDFEEGENTTGPQGYWVSDLTLNTTYHIHDLDHKPMLELAKKKWNGGKKLGKCIWAGTPIQGKGEFAGYTRKDIYFDSGIKIMADDRVKADFPHVITITSYSPHDIIYSVQTATSISFGPARGMVPYEVLRIGLENQRNGDFRLAHKDEDAITMAKNWQRVERAKLQKYYSKRDQYHASKR